MNLEQRINQDIKKAMLQKSKEELTALRAIKSMILLAATEKGRGEGIDEEKEKKILTKAAKQRREAAEIFKKENREELYRKEIAELEVINKYLPKPLSQEDLDKEVKKIITDLNASGLQDLGKVMGVAIKALMGKAEGKAISDAVRRELLP